jgi:ribosomal protein S12 methylthiotransferase
MEPEHGPVEPYLYHDLTPRVLSTPHHFAYMKIAEGCDHPCTFCVIPQYRGAFRSRRFESVISEATRLFQQGIREINLIGQDTTCYGEDLGLPDGLADLLARLAQIETPTEKWIRFLYAYPNKVTQRSAGHHRRTHGAGQIYRHAAAACQRARTEAHEARRIGRHFPQADRAHPPHHSRRRHRTSFIVGFPGETAEDFEELCQFVQAARFDNLGVFTYSDEDTSASYALDGKVDGRTIQNRKRRLMAIQRKIARCAQSLAGR